MSILKKIIIISILGLFAFTPYSEAIAKVKESTNRIIASKGYTYDELIEMGAVPVKKDGTFDPSKYGATPVNDSDKQELSTSTQTSTFIYSSLNIIMKVGGILLLLIILYKIIIPVLYKPDYIKNKKNTALFILAGLIACIAISLFFGMDNTPPCLEREYDTRGSHCVEYDDTTAPLSYKDKIDYSGKIFGITFSTFIYFVYRKKKEQKIGITSV